MRHLLPLLRLGDALRVRLDRVLRHEVEAIPVHQPPYKWKCVGVQDRRPVPENPVPSALPLLQERGDAVQERDALALNFGDVVRVKGMTVKGIVA